MNYTAFDRFKDALKGRPRDRVPVLGGNSLWAATNFPEASYKEIASDPDLIVKSQLWAHDLIGIDALYPAPDALFIAEAFGCGIRFSETGPLVDPLTLSLDRRKDVESVVFPNPRASGRFPVVLEATRLLRKEAKGEIPLIGTFEGAFTNTCRIIEVEQILRMTYKKPQVLDELLDRMNAFLIDFAMAFVESGVNILFIPEPTASSSMISPMMFRRFVLPRLQNFTNQLDVPIVLHICGDTKPILKAMGESGAEILSLDQCMDLAESRAAVPAMSLGGNVDPVKSLLMGDTAEVEKDAHHCLRKAGTDRFILMPGCGIPPNAPTENLKAMVKAAEDFGL